MSNVTKFSSDQVYVYMLVIDESGSMDGDERNVRAGIQNLKESLQGFPESNSIVISICKFNEYFYQGDFQKVEEISTNYSAAGGTALYRSIKAAADYLQKYLNAIRRLNKIEPTAVTYFLLSDGMSSGGCIDMDEKQGQKLCKEVIENLNLQGINTAFVAFGTAINSKFGENLGFKATIDIKNRNQLLEFLGVHLSESIKNQSQRLEPLGANFFSKAAGYSSASEGYSNTTAQALEDDSWIDDI